MLLVVLLTACGKSSVKGDHYIIGRDPSFYPLDFGGQTTPILAFSDELVQAVAQQESFTASFVSITFDLIPVVLKSGRVDGVLSSLPSLPQYRDIYDFSDVYLEIGPVLVVPTNSAAQSLDDMKGRTVGAIGGSSSMLQLAKVPGIVIRDYTNLGIAFEDLLTGQLDGVVAPALPSYAYLRDFYSNRLRVATPPLNDAGLRLLVRKGHNAALLKAFDEGLKTLRENGRYNELQSKWRLNLEQGVSQSNEGKEEAAGAA